MRSYFGSHGLNHAINEGIDGWGDAALTALEVMPLMGVGKAIIKEGPALIRDFIVNDIINFSINFDISKIIATFAPKRAL